VALRPRFSPAAIGSAFAVFLAGGRSMKYLIAWMLGVPGGLILLWMLANAAC
jgi:hypothetical protein